MFPTIVEIDWYWLLTGLLPVAVLAWVGKYVGLTSLLISRRETKPRHYIKMLRARTTEGDGVVDEIYVELKMMIRGGKIVPANLAEWQMRAMMTLGFPGFNLSPEFEFE